MIGRHRQRTAWEALVPLPPTRARTPVSVAEHNVWEGEPDTRSNPAFKGGRRAAKARRGEVIGDADGPDRRLSGCQCSERFLNGQVTKLVVK